MDEKQASAIIELLTGILGELKSLSERAEQGRADVARAQHQQHAQASRMMGMLGKHLPPGMAEAILGTAGGNAGGPGDGE